MRTLRHSWSLVLAVFVLAWMPADSSCKVAKKPPSTAQKVQRWHHESKLNPARGHGEPLERLSGTRAMVVLAEMFEDIAHSAQKQGSLGKTGIRSLDQFILEAKEAKPLPFTLDNLISSSNAYGSTSQSRSTTTEGLYRTASALVGKRTDWEPVRVIAFPKVMPFAQDFIKGAMNPGHFIHEERKRSAPNGRNFSILERWRAAPNERRIFITGERRDQRTVNLLKSILAPQGFELFFYLDCKPLCAPTTVGAMFNSSGTVFHIESRGKRGEFVPIEVMIIATMQRYSGEVEVKELASLQPGHIAVYEPGTLIRPEGLDRSVIQALVFDCVLSDLRPLLGSCGPKGGTRRPAQ